jgi:hypothetical protein
MRRFVVLSVLLLIAAVAALAVIGARTENPARRPSPQGSTGRTPLNRGGAGQTPAAARLAAMQHIKEAQKEYLRVLIAAPGDADAMRWVVEIRRQLMGGDPAALRRQAALYQQAAALGRQTPEHYDNQSMRILALADLQAAAEIEAEREAAAGRLPTEAAPGMARGPASTDSSSSSPPPAGARQPDATHPPTPGARAQTAAPKAGNGTTRAKPRAGSPPSRSGAPLTATQPPKGAASPPKTPATPVPPSPASPDSSQTAIPVQPSDAQPALVQNQGSLIRVDCQRRSFVLRGPGGDQEYIAANDSLIYVRGAQSEKLADFCALERFLGHTVLAWSRTEGDRRIATDVSVLPTP